MPVFRIRFDRHTACGASLFKLEPQIIHQFLEFIPEIFTAGVLKVFPAFIVRTACDIPLSFHNHLTGYF